MAPLLQPKQFKVKRRKALLELLKREIENNFMKKSEFNKGSVDEIRTYPSDDDDDDAALQMCLL